MSKSASFVALLACALVATGALTGCAASAVSGGSTASPGGTAGPTSNPAPSGDDLTTVPKACPKPSEVSSLVGFTVPSVSPTMSAAGLACSYVGTMNIVEINFHSAPSGTTAASVKAELESGASTGDVVLPISGFGDAALTATPAQGGAAILVWNKGVEFSVVDGRNLDGVERVALGVLAGD